MERDSFTQELNQESQPSEREQVGFLGIQGKTFPIYDGPNKIGRDPGSCSIALDNGTLSRLHAVINIVSSNGQRTINLMDIGSRNKTRVGLKVLQNFVPYPLNDGDSVQFGELHGVFRVLQPKCDFLPMTQDFAMTQDMPCTQVVPESPHVNHMGNNIRSNVIVPESPDVGDKEDSLIFKSPMLISKNKPNFKLIQAKTLSKKLSDVAIANNFLNNTTKSMIFDQTTTKTAFRFSNESNKSCDSDKTNDNEVSNNKICVRTSEESNKSSDSIFQADTQLPNPNSPSIHSLETQIPTDVDRSNNIDIEKEKQAFEDSLLNENDDIHIASTQIILKDTLKKFTNDISNINDADTQMFNNSDSNINELQTQVFACEAKNKDVSYLETQVFGVNDLRSANTQVFNNKDLCDAQTQLFPEDKTVETAVEIKQEKTVINNAETQFDSRDDDDFCNLNTQILAEDIAPTDITKEINISKKSQEVAFRKPALVDSPDIIEDDDAKDNFNELNTQILKVNEQLTPDLVVPETSEETDENPVDKPSEVESKPVQDKELLESDEEITFEALQENDDEQYNISLSQNILGDSEAIIETAPVSIEKTFKSPLRPVTPRKKKSETKTVHENTKDVDIADMCTQIVKLTSKSPAAFEDEEILTQCDISFEDMPTQVLTYERCLEDSKMRVTEVSLRSVSVASLSKKSSGNTSGELENSSSFLSPRKFIAMDLPDSQEIELNINQSSDVEDNQTLSDSEQEPNTLENTPILYKSKPKNIKKERKNVVKKSLDFTNLELPVRVMTRIRKPTARLIDADPQSKKAVENILKPKISDEVDTDILSENITRLKTNKNYGNDSTTADVKQPTDEEVKLKKESVKNESKTGSLKNDNNTKKATSKIEKAIKKETTKKEDCQSKRKSAESTTSKEESKRDNKTNARSSKRRSDEDIIKPETSKKSSEPKQISDGQNTKQADKHTSKRRSDETKEITPETSKNTLESKQISDNQNDKEKTDKQKDNKSSKHTDKHTSREKKSKKIRSNSVSSDETEPRRKRTRLEQKKDDNENKLHEQKRNTSKSRPRQPDEQIDLTKDDTAKKTTKTDQKSKNTKDTDKKTDRKTRNDKDSVKTPTKTNKSTKPDLIDSTALESKTNTNSTKTERKIKGILKNVNHIDKYFVKEPSPLNRIELRKRPLDLTEVEVKKRRVDSQRTSRKQKEATSYKVLFTAFHNEEVKKKLVELGAILVTEITECDVLVTVQIKRTFKLLCAVGLGKPIVGPQWVQKCVDSGCFVDPWLYVIKDEVTESKFKFDLKSTLKGKRNFLRGYKVSSTPSVNPKEDEMKQIVECSGGKWGTGGRKWLCVTSMLDKHAWPSLETKGATLLHVEFILHGALTQSFNTDSYKLTGK